ncbi:MAG: antitermination regulator [Pseudonocardiales bacterium]|nr:GAF and ANTAR domain-containing protein [Actinomycetota bacterium]PZS23492.1 MAG: antitermination regulator [Pseudonocardiales bacterium]
MEAPAVGPSAAAELQQLLIDTETLTQFLTEVAQYAATTLGPGLFCGITLRRDGSPFTVAGSDPTATNLDEVQYGHHDGPCLTAMRTGEVVTITDLTTEDRWGAYRVDALAHGIGSVLSLPLLISPGVYGALNLYSRQPGIFTAEQRARAEGFAGEATRALHLAWRLADQVELTHHLETALTSRGIIDQALGIIMSQNRCTADEAFDVLRAASSHRNTKLRDVAHDLITRVSGKSPEPSTRFHS